MFRSFEWLYWNDDAFTVFLIGLMTWGWFRAFRACLRVLMLCLPKRKKRKKKCKRNWRNRVKRFHRRKLPYHLVLRCRRRDGQRPPRLDGSRFPSPRCSKHRRWRRRDRRRRRHQEREKKRKDEQSAREKQMRDYIEFCELPRPKPRHVDAPVWEPLLDWFCFESPCSENFPAYGRVVADPVAGSSDKLASRLKQFIDEEDHEANVTRLLSRAAEHKAKRAQKHNSHQHKKSKCRSVGPLQRVLHASGRTALTCITPRATFLGSAERMSRAYRVENDDGPKFDDTPLIWDTGASNGLTCHPDDFIDFVPMEVKVKDVTKVNTVVGVGTTLHKMTDTRGVTAWMPCISYLLPTTDVRLYSPQTYHQLFGGYSKVDGDNVRMVLSDRDIVIPIERERSNLPIIYDSHTTERERELHGPEILDSLPFKRCAHLFRPDKEWFGASLSHFEQFDPNALSSMGTPEEAEAVLEEFDDWVLTSRGLPAQILAEENANLCGPEKELLLWEWKLGISMYRIQELMRSQKLVEPDGTEYNVPPVIIPQFKSTPNIKPPFSAATRISLGKNKPTGARISKEVPPDQREPILSRTDLDLGDIVHVDQFVVGSSGRLELGYGKEGDKSRYHGGTIYVEGCSDFIWLENQVSLSASATVFGKEKFEEYLLNTANVRVDHYHSDNGIFQSAAWRDHCRMKSQTQSFSGVNAQHQNAKAERAIGIVMNMARTFMVNVSLNWAGNGVNNVNLWPLAVKHAVWLYNRIPNRTTGLTPLERLTGIKSDHRDLRRTHVWGCPAFVLESRLANGQKLPKFDWKRRRGQFVGYSAQHSSTVACIRNLNTGYISPVFDVLFDDKFTTIFCSKYDKHTVDDKLEELLPTDYESYGHEERGDDGKLVYRSPPLDEVWLTADEIRDRRAEIKAQKSSEAQREAFKPVSGPRAEPEIISLHPRKPNHSPDANMIPDDSDDDSVDSVSGDSSPQADSESEGEFGDGGDGWGNLVDDDSSEAEPAEVEPRRSRRTADKDVIGQTDEYKERGNVDDSQVGRDESGRSRRLATNRPDPRSMAARRAAKTKYERKMRALRLQRRSLHQLFAKEPHQARRCRKEHEFMSVRQQQRASDRFDMKGLLARDNSLLAAMAPEKAEHGDSPSLIEVLNSPLARYIKFAANECGYGEPEVEDLLVNTVHPLFLKAKSAASKGDNPNWWQAMESDYADEFWEAAQLEIRTLEEMGAWEVVDRTPDMNVIGGTWAFKIKRFPDELIKKFKARFCARGDQQLKGVDFFEVYAPVVQWSTVRLMLILQALLGLKSKQGDITCAFLHADVPEDEKIHVEMPRVSSRKERSCACARRFMGFVKVLGRSGST